MAIEIPKPSEDKEKIHSENHHKQLKVFYFIYADSESLILNIAGPVKDSSINEKQQTARHEAWSYRGVVVRSDRQIQPPQVYRWPDTA